MDIWVMVDVVHNHVGAFDDPSEIYPFNKMEYYHPFCLYEDDPYDANNREMCRLGVPQLPDLDQTHPFVDNYLKTWINGFIKKYKFDGIRLDTVFHVDKHYHKEF